MNVNVLFFYFRNKIIITNKTNYIVFSLFMMTVEGTGWLIIFSSTFVCCPPISWLWLFWFSPILFFLTVIFLRSYNCSSIIFLNKFSSLSYCYFHLIFWWLICLWQGWNVSCLVCFILVIRPVGYFGSSSSFPLVEIYFGTGPTFIKGSGTCFIREGSNFPPVIMPLFRFPFKVLTFLVFQSLRRVIRSPSVMWVLGCHRLNFRNEERNGVCIRHLMPVGIITSTAMFRIGEDMRSRFQDSSVAESLYDES